MVHFEGLVACICEGSAEHAIMDILLENKLLIFTELLDDKIIRTRSAKDFEAKYLRKGFADKLTILRILDSRGEKFELISVCLTIENALKLPTWRCFSGIISAWDCFKSKTGNVALKQFVFFQLIIECLARNT